MEATEKSFPEGHHGRRRSKGSSLFGVDALIVLLIVSLQYQYTFLDMWFLIITRGEGFVSCIQVPTVCNSTSTKKLEADPCFRLHQIKISVHQSDFHV
ncbi:hypothetical protein A4A49_04666 [Nicotiana attenuata]|uniref:Uncharacterized protein n=1 Tax=Nicotiana attenuata TaxID=49451 RepID=A0A1J6JNG5_NICAT|nr:hypothetical protein A4A49_04666 [Nicotiana attenuata]